MLPLNPAQHPNNAKESLHVEDIDTLHMYTLFGKGTSPENLETLSKSAGRNKTSDYFYSTHPSHPTFHCRVY